jgi:PAS domain S-box-containing protein
MSAPTVLIVEDEAIVAQDLNETVTRLGYEVVGVAASADGAITQTTASLPDVVLMDIRLQDGRDGVDAAVEIHRTLAIPVVFLTAFSDEATLRRVKADEPYAYLLKPVDERELEVALAAAIRRGRETGKFRRGEEWLNLVLRNVADGVIATSAGAVRYVNPAAEQMTGWRQDEAMGQALAGVFRTVGDVRRRLDVAGRPNTIQETLVARDGTERPIEMQITPFGGPEPGEVLVFRDIGERLRSERALRISEERLRLATTGAHLGTFDYFPRTNTLIWDTQCREFWGLPPDAEVNPEVWLAGIHPDDRERVEAETARVVAGASGDVIDMEYRTLGLRNGVERWISVRGTTFFDDEGVPNRLAGTMRDVTERHQMEEVRDRLTGVFAHDLRAPLSAIAMGARLMRSRPGTLSEENLRVVDMTARSSERMAMMIQQLLDFTRARLGGGMLLSLERIDVAALCREVAKEVEVASPGHTIRCEGPPQSIGMWDRVALGRILSNLLVNAVQHGGADVVRLQLYDAIDEVVIEVNNRGAPIPKDVLPMLFDPFRRGKGATRDIVGGAAGLGLGLYIAKELVGAHGGRIEVRSTAEEGTTFVVRLPRGMPPHANASVRATS